MNSSPLLVVLLLICLQVFSQNTVVNVPVPMPFLLINSDARSGGMGDVGVSTSSDSFSVFHNPSKITFYKRKKTISLSYTPWMRNLADDVFVGGISYMSRLGEYSGFGVDLKYYSLGNFNVSSTNNSIDVQEKPNEFSMTGVYSMKLSDYFSMGVGLKYINSNFRIKGANISVSPVNSFAVDISGFYEADEKNYGSFNGVYRLGFNISNIGPKVSYTPGSENFIPTNLRLGVGFDFIFDDTHIFSTHVEFSKLLIPYNQSSEKGWFEGIFYSFNDRSFESELEEIDWLMGVEYLFNNKFALRGGYHNGSEQKGNKKFFSLGVGFASRNYTINISYLINTSDIINPLENTLRFSLAFDFGLKY